MTCRACIVVDDAGAVLWARRAAVGRANASTTKMVTALVVVRRLPLDAEVSVSDTAAATGGGGLDLSAGAVWDVEELLYALLLTSSNDAAVALAERAAGSEAAFVAVMNATARRLGARDAHFVTAHGLDRPGHEASARDLATIAARLLDVPALRRIVGTESVVVAGPTGPVTLENRNLLLETYRGAIGVKTGFTDDAGDVLVAAAERRGRRVVAVAMGSDDAARDAGRLLDYGFGALRRSVLVAAGRAVGWLVFDPGGAVPAAADATVRGLADPSAVRISFRPRSGVHLPLAPGDRVGTVAVAAGGRRIASVAAVAAAPATRRAAPGALEVIGSVLDAAHDVGRIVTPW